MSVFTVIAKNPEKKKEQNNLFYVIVMFQCSVPVSFAHMRKKIKCFLILTIYAKLMKCLLPAV